MTFAPIGGESEDDEAPPGGRSARADAACFAAWLVLLFGAAWYADDDPTGATAPAYPDQAPWDSPRCSPRVGDYGAVPHCFVS